MLSFADTMGSNIYQWGINLLNALNSVKKYPLKTLVYFLSCQYLIEHAVGLQYTGGNEFQIGSPRESYADIGGYKNKFFSTYVELDYETTLLSSTIYGQTFNDNGSPYSPVFPVNDPYYYALSNTVPVTYGPPSIAMFDENTSIIVWPYRRRIYGRLIDINGMPTSPRFLIFFDQDKFNDLFEILLNPSVVVLDKTTFLVTWSARYKKSAYGKIFFRNGIEKSNVFTITNQAYTTYGGIYLNAAKSTARFNNGKIVTTWEDSSYGYGQFAAKILDINGNDLIGKFRISTLRSIKSQSIATIDNNTFVVARLLQSKNGCAVGIFNINGSAILPEFPIYYSYASTVNSIPGCYTDNLGNNHFIIVYYEVGKKTIYGKIFDKIGSLVVNNIMVSTDTSDLSPRGVKGLGIEKFMVIWHSYKAKALKGRIFSWLQPPTLFPTHQPTTSPTLLPSQFSTYSPSLSATPLPSLSPTNSLNITSTASVISRLPSIFPTKAPYQNTKRPQNHPTHSPTLYSPIFSTVKQNQTLNYSNSTLPVTTDNIESPSKKEPPKDHSTFFILVAISLGTSSCIILGTSFFLCKKFFYSTLERNKNINQNHVRVIEIPKQLPMQNKNTLPIRSDKEDIKNEGNYSPNSLA